MTSVNQAGNEVVDGKVLKTALVLKNSSFLASISSKIGYLWSYVIVFNFCFAGIIGDSCMQRPVDFGRLCNFLVNSQRILFLARFFSHIFNYL